MLDAQDRELPARDGSAVAFKVRHLSASKGLTMLTELIKMFGPAFGILIDSAGGLDAKASITDLVSQKAPGNMFERGALALVGQLDNDRVQRMVSQLRDETEVQISGKWIELKGQYELLFRGQQLLLLRWLAFALEVQFGDFFALRDSLGTLGSRGAAPGNPA